ncbi:hypothetical protein [Fictibacillus barbaricus]|uniref:Uncharacterized protein n=1 Tax=Fictibacillus barbaricus TaxID=182136 RepID=A0ABU1U646_9BACL|nr:hypothetical protein [Fictibacillus barbaricus]MDR7074964.1 hypothetical protein [Fictibacillus barbaricus]
MTELQTFANASGACVETSSGVLVTIAVAGPTNETSEGTIIGVAYQGKNVVFRLSSNKKINVNKIQDLSELPDNITKEIQKVVDEWSNNSRLELQ